MGAAPLGLSCAGAGSRLLPVHTSVVCSALCQPHACIPRLKAAGGNKTIEGLLALGCDKRVVLTGTPVQNDLMVRALCGCCNDACHDARALP